MDTFWKVLEILGPSVAALAVAGLGWLLAHLTSYVNAKAKNAWLAGVLARLDDFVLTAVKDVQQTAVADLKLQTGGSLSAGDKAKFKADAINKVKSYWGPQGLQDAAKILGLDQLDSLISGKIEAAVHDVAQQQDALKVNDVSSPKPAMPAQPSA